MDINGVFKFTTFLLVLLNPFLVIVYLVDVMDVLSFKKFRNVLLRAGFISLLAFWLFALMGDIIFKTFIKAEFASFQIFGGVVFLIIGIQFVFKGKSAIEGLRGESQHIAGAIAMPILIGPGTLSYCVIVGKKLDPIPAMVAVFIAVFSCIAIMVLFKKVYDTIHAKKEDLLQRYFEIAGRVTAIIIGTISIDMIMQGIKYWINK